MDGHGGWYPGAMPGRALRAPGLAPTASRHTSDGARGPLRAEREDASVEQCDGEMRNCGAVTCSHTHSLLVHHKHTIHPRRVVRAAVRRNDARATSCAFATDRQRGAGCDLPLVGRGAVQVQQGSAHDGVAFERGPCYGVLFLVARANRAATKDNAADSIFLAAAAESVGVCDVCSGRGGEVAAAE